MEFYNDTYKVFKEKQKAEKDGLLVSTNNVVEPIRTELNKELGAYFRDNYKLKSYYSEDEGENILDHISSYLDTIGYDDYLEYPYSEGEDEYLIPITPNLKLYVHAYDEYYGSGDYSKGVIIERFIITEEATTVDVDKLIEVLKEYNIQ